MKWQLWLQGVGLRSQGRKWPLPETGSRTRKRSSGTFKAELGVSQARRWEGPGGRASQRAAWKREGPQAAAGADGREHRSPAAVKRGGEVASQRAGGQVQPGGRELARWVGIQ